HALQCLHTSASDSHSSGHRWGHRGKPVHWRAKSLPVRRQNAWAAPQSPRGTPIDWFHFATEPPRALAAHTPRWRSRPRSQMPKSPPPSSSSTDSGANLAPLPVNSEPGLAPPHCPLVVRLAFQLPRLPPGLAHCLFLIWILVTAVQYAKKYRDKK